MTGQVPAVERLDRYLLLKEDRCLLLKMQENNLSLSSGLDRYMLLKEDECLLLRQDRCPDACRSSRSHYIGLQKQRWA